MNSMQALGLLQAVVLFVVILNVQGFQSYVDKIPNGNRVERTVSLCLGLTEDRKKNSFGKDFLNAGLKWTKQLCQGDSDGDGKSNGEELGKRQCLCYYLDKVQHINHECSRPMISGKITEDSIEVIFDSVQY